MNNEQLAAPAPPSSAVEPGFNNADTFALLQRAAKLLSSSTLVPPQYRALLEIKEYGKVVGTKDNPNAIANCVIALNIARRMRADELMVMQNLYIVEGRPAWSSQWVIAAVNTSGKFSPLRFEITDLGSKDVKYSVTEWVDGKKKVNEVSAKIQNLQCIAWAKEKETGERVESPPVTMEMAVAEGWFAKSGSKWQTMPQVMLRYRAASFFGKIYAPELLMGLPTGDEVADFEPEERSAKGREVPAARVPALLPEKAPALERAGAAIVANDTAKAAVERMAVAAGIDMARVWNYMRDNDFTAAHEPTECYPNEWAKAESRWPEIEEACK